LQSSEKSLFYTFFINKCIHETTFVFCKDAKLEEAIIREAISNVSHHLTNENQRINARAFGSVPNRFSSVPIG